MGADVIRNIIHTCEKLGEASLGGIKLEDADGSLLDVTKFTIDQHVAMQPSAIAYFGFLKRVTARKLARIVNEYDHWSKRKYAEAKASVEAGTSGKTNVKVEDVKSRLQTDNESKIKEWEARIDSAEEESDAVDSFFEAWKQKSFSIRETVSIEEDERFTSTSMSGNKEQAQSNFVKTDRVREIMRKRREQQN